MARSNWFKLVPLTRDLAKEVTGLRGAALASVIRVALKGAYHLGFKDGGQAQEGYSKQALAKLTPEERRVLALNA